MHSFIIWCKLSVNVNVIVNVYVESVDIAASSVLTKILSENSYNLRSYT